MTKSWKQKSRKHWGLTILVALPLVLASLAARADDGPQLLGNWSRDDGGTRMAITPCSENFCATNTWVQNPNGKEHVGDELILKLKPISNSVLQGQAYDVRRKMTYKMTITLQGEKMRTTGCVLLGIICKNAGWTRSP